MSYTALYRKFRPLEFEDVKGQDHIVTTLKNQIKADRIGHAYLFCGTRGTGKTTIAKIFAKAVSLDIACYEDPAFYDKYQRATDVLAWSLFDSASAAVTAIIASIISLALVIGTVTSIDPRYLVLLLPSALVFVVEVYKSKVVYKRDKEMTTNNRIKAYIQRTVFLKDFSKDMRTSNIFSVLMVRFKNAIDSNVEILRKYGVKLFLYSAVSTLFGEFIPVIGTYALAAYQFVFTKALTVSAFSVVLASINSVKESTMRIAQNFEVMSRFAYYFQNMSEFLDFESKVADGSVKCESFESLEFKNVSFAYREAPVLKNVSFKINKGERIALLGDNGTGKTTLLNGVLRLYRALGISCVLAAPTGRAGRWRNPPRGGR